ncbi:MAG: hypothetical protein PWQ31_1313 [Eubacteriales bacterium]|nr:hypothetical protein [Eubacteriales bacterium]
MSNRYTLLGEKPYAFVPPVERRGGKQAPTHERYQDNHYSGKIVVEFTALTPVAVSAGSYKFVDGKYVQDAISHAGKPVLPGSSVKGVVRAVAEAVSASCFSVTMGINKHLLEKALPKQNSQKCSDYRAACPACSLFGLAGKESLKSRVEFGEFTTVGDVKLELRQLPQLERPFKDYPQKKSDAQKGQYLQDLARLLGGREERNLSNYGNERLYYCRLCSSDEGCLTCTKDDFWRIYSQFGNPKQRELRFRGRKFYFHGQEPLQFRTNYHYRAYAPAGTRFQGEVYFRNLTREEYGLLLYALGAGGEFCLKIGYGKPLFYGSVATKIVRAEKYHLSAELPDVNSAIQAYKDSTPFLDRQRQELEKILSWKKPLGKPRSSPNY